MPKKIIQGPKVFKVAAQISDCKNLDDVWDRIVTNSKIETLEPDLKRLLKSVFMLGFKACVRSIEFNKFVKWSADLNEYITDADIIKKS